MQKLNDNKFLRADGSNLAPFFRDFQLREDPLNPNFINLEWVHSGSDAYFSINDFSDGTLRFICLCTLLLQPFPPPIIILDEPELGLHPSAIEVFVSLLHEAIEAKSCQFVIATQSALLIDYFQPEDVVVAERKNEASVFKRLTKEELSAWLEDYSLGDLWQKNIFGGRP